MMVTGVRSLARRVLLHRRGLHRADHIFTHTHSSEKDLLFSLARQKAGGVGVEIGSAFGASSCFIAAGLRPNGGRYCIDTWNTEYRIEGEIYANYLYGQDGNILKYAWNQEQQRIVYEPCGQADGDCPTFNLFLENTRDFADVIKPVRADSVEATVSVSDKVDFLFVDGWHEHSGVQRDWQAWKPRLGPGAIVVFHDYGWARGVQQVVAEEVMPAVVDHGALSEHVLGEAASVNVGPDTSTSAPTPLTLGESRSDENVAERERSEMWETLKPRLNAARVAYYGLDASRVGAIRRVAASALLHEAHFGFAAKHLYARLSDGGLAPRWARKVYDSHLYAFNRFNEDDGSGKQGAEQFRRRFDSLLASIEHEGFDGTRTVVPMTKDRFVLDGGHRVAACLYHGRDLTVVEVEAPASNWDFRFFRRRGMPAVCMDDVALEFCRIDQGMRLALLWSSSSTRRRDVRRALRQRGDVYFEKGIYLNRLGAANLRRQLRRVDSELGEATTAFRDRRTTLHLFVWKSVEAAVVTVDVVNADDVYVTKSSAATLELAKQLLNLNTVELWCNVPLRDAAVCDTFQGSVPGEQTESRCVAGMAALALHGLKDVTTPERVCMSRDSSTANETSARALGGSMTPVADELVFNPENHCYYDGVKVATLDAIRRSGQGPSWDGASDG